MTTSVLYLHGFASSPAAYKGTALRAPLQERGVHYDIPDLNAPSFETVTLTAILARVAQSVQACTGGPVHLIGSSLGGLAALHFIDRFPEEAARVGKLVLLAPALDFIANRNRDPSMPPDWQARWQQAGSMPVFHHAHEREIPVHYGFIEDVARYDSWGLQFSQPTLILHGQQDASVPYTDSERFARSRPNVTLRLLDTDHSMTDSVGALLAYIVPFLGL